MESIAELKIAHSSFYKPKHEISTSATFNNTRFVNKLKTSKYYISNKNIINSILDNDSTKNIPISSSVDKKSSYNNLISKLNLNKNKETESTDEINLIKEELNKKKTSLNLLSRKSKNTKIRINKKDLRASVKKSIIIPQQERMIKSPRTIFQKIIVNFDKLKKRTDKTLDVMKKNLKITREEIKNRKKEERYMQILSTTYMQNLGDKNNKRKRNNFLNFKSSNNNGPSFYITNYKNKSLSNIFPNISSNNQSISNGSSSILNYINETGGYNTNMKNNISSSLNMNSDIKTVNKKTFFQITKNSPKIKKERDDSDSSEKIRLFNIPEINLSSLNSTKVIKPLFPPDKNKKVYKNMFHYRTLDFSLSNIRKQLYKIYGMPALLVEQTTFNSENEMNTLLINNKISLIQESIEYFKINIMYKHDFLESFNNMESYQKADFNYNLEEISCVLIKIIPIILQNYYQTIKKLISIVIPNIKQERLKKPETESQCLNINYSFFKSSTEYFNICIEVYHILNSKVDRFIYSKTEFGPINSYLDIIRFATNNIISISSAFINKTKSDKKILDKMEVGLNLKKAVKEEIDILERYHLRHRRNASEWDLKIQRVNKALDIKNWFNKDENNGEKNRPWKKIKIDNNKIKKKTSAFNSTIFRNMLKYFKPEIKSKIIALQIVDRYEMKKNEFNNFQNEDDNQDGCSRKIYV